MKKMSLHPVVFALLLPAAAAFAQQKMDDMKGMDMGKKPADASASMHKTVGTIKWMPRPAP